MPEIQSKRCVAHGAQQPAPEIADVLYIGLASYLPAELRPLCSCAGLFFARLCSRGDGVSVQVAALPHYLNDYDREACSRHVQTVPCSEEGLRALMEYEWRMNGMATCDVRDLVIEHIKQVIPQSTSSEELMEVSVATDSIQSDTRAALSGNVGTCNAPTTRNHEPQQLDVDRARFEHEQVIIPLDEIRELVSGASSSSRSLLRAALTSLRLARKQEKQWRKKKALKEKEKHIRLVLECQDIPLRQLLEVTPLYGCGKRWNDTITACRIDVDVPMIAA